MKQIAAGDWRNSDAAFFGPEPAGSVAVDAGRTGAFHASVCLASRLQRLARAENALAIDALAYARFRVGADTARRQDQHREQESLDDCTQEMLHAAIFLAG